MRRGEIQSLQWQQIDFLNRTLTVGTSKTDAGTGRVIPLNGTALMTLQTWATNFPERKPEHFLFPSEHYGLAGNDRKPHAKTMDPTKPAGEIKTAWEAAKKKVGVESRFHDLRHTACTRLLERGASLPVVASIMGWSPSTTAKMVKRYGHIGTDVQRTALDALVATPPSEKRKRTSARPRRDRRPRKQIQAADSHQNL